MPDRAFPVLYAADVRRAARFWERLGFGKFVEIPSAEQPGYVGLRRGGFELAVVAAEWPVQHYGLQPGSGPRFEMFVYVADVDRLVGELRAEGVVVLAEPTDMPWGERIASVADPDGNPVALANERRE